MDNKLQDKLAKILALTNSPVEGEAAAATHMLQRLLAEHNLDIADLEKRGHAAPAIEERGHDLGKAAFKWKLDLAEAVAAHFYCHAIVCRTRKTVVFLGRPDNVESMKMLYAWLIDQIRRISAAARVEHQKSTGEHVDPLRWQVNFGLGVVSRLKARLDEVKARREKEQADAAGTAIVIHHQSEISDYTEKTYGFRTDGKKTASQVRHEENMVKWEAVWKAEAEAKVARKTDLRAAGDLATLYAEFPEEKPKTEAQKRKAAREDEAYWDRVRAQRLRDEAKERNLSPEERRKREQAEGAKVAGQAAAKDVNLEPFLEGGEVPMEATKLR